ncbi:MAG: hypothetical protein AAFY98_04725 [Verrucomicrobiota bacterium]
MIYRALIVFLLLPSLCLAEDEGIREGKPKDCHLFSWGKGPNWIAEVPTEFQLNYLESRQPVVDDRFFESTADALGWRQKEHELQIEEIARVDGRKIIRAEYTHKGEHRQILDLILLAIETDENSDWFSPFFVASPELFSGRFVSGDDVAFGYLATLKYSGTGAMRTHHLFDLRAHHPKLVNKVDVGRVRSVDYDSDEEYQRALNVFENEKEICRANKAMNSTATRVTSSAKQEPRHAQP